MDKTNWMDRYDEIREDVEADLQEYGDAYVENNAHDETLERIQELQKAEDEREERERDARDAEALWNREYGENK